MKDGGQHHPGGQQVFQRLREDLAGSSWCGAAGQSRPACGRFGAVCGRSPNCSFACGRLGLVVSPKSIICCSDVKTETLGTRDPFRRHEQDPRLGCRHGGSARRAVGVMRNRLCEAAKRSQRLCGLRSHTKNFSAAGLGTAPSIMQGIRSRAVDAVCPKWWVCHA